jgi:hypothetical protein
MWPALKDLRTRNHGEGPGEQPIKTVNYASSNLGRPENGLHKSSRLTTVTPLNPALLIPPVSE